MAQLPLSDITVLDLSRQVCGQFTAKCLSWLGARVVLAEEPGGARTRHMGPFYKDQTDPEASLLFMYLNTNKESITLDLHSRSGVEVFKKLVKKADVLVEDYPPAEAAKLGLDYATISRLNPRLVVLSVTDFGQTGPYRDWKATDLTLLAMGGMSQMIGAKEREPLSLAGYQGHYNGSVHAFAATLIALWQRDLTGQGEHIDVSLHDAMAFSEWKGFTFYAADGKLRSKGTEATATSYMLPCRDGYVGFMVNRPGYLEPLIKLTNLEPLKDPKYAQPGALDKHADEIRVLLAEWVKDKGKEEVYHKSQRLGLPFCYFPSMAELVDSPQYKSRQFLVDVDHPVTGKTPYPGAPMKYAGMEFPNRRAPLLGEHNKTVYRELGLDGEAQGILREREVI